MRMGAVLLPLLLVASAAQGAPTPPTRPSPAPASFESLLGALSRAEAAGDKEGSSRALQEIRRARIERNVDGHQVVGLAFVRIGAERLERGDRDGAEEAFGNAVRLAPGLPDGHYGLAVAQLRRGLGLVPSVKSSIAGTAAFLETARGRLRAFRLLAVTLVACGFALAWAIGGVLLARHVGLFKHDIDEKLGGAGRRWLALPLLLAVFLLPAAALQGWGWLPLWWLALLFAYMDRSERVVSVAIVVGALTVGPAVSALDFQLRTLQNPLYGAGLSAVEDAPDPGEVALLEQAAREDPGDRDLQYLLGGACKRTGRYDEAAALYAAVLAADARDAYARNNLANIDFVRGAFDAALARYREGTEGAASAEIAATSYYNLSLAHLQKFDYQAYDEAKSNADRLARELTAQYDRWKYDSGDYAVVDLGLDARQLWAKVAGQTKGVARRNVTSSVDAVVTRGASLSDALVSRFAAALVLLVAVAFLVDRWRGRKALTVHCARCGTAFCRLCHLGQASGGLCSQCFHLFVVRDGVSGPARNRKMAEVQDAESRRDRVFRVLSIVLPGAGHLYTGHALVGTLLLSGWVGLLALLASSRMLPLTDVPSRLVPPWPLAAAGVALVAIWVSANRLKPDFDIPLPVAPRPGARRARATQGV